MNSKPKMMRLQYLDYFRNLEDDSPYLITEAAFEKWLKPYKGDNLYFMVTDWDDPSNPLYFDKEAFYTQIHFTPWERDDHDDHEPLEYDDLKGGPNYFIRQYHIAVFRIIDPTSKQVADKTITDTINPQDHAGL